MDNNLSIRVENVSKKYRLGAIGGQTLREDLQSWVAKLRGKEDPNSKIGADHAQTTGDFWALKNISFEVQKGERIGIIGHNGAGKSTLLKLLSRVTAPSEGKISYNGRIASMLEVGTGFHPELTGRENVYMNGAILGMTKAEIDKKFDEIVEFAEIGKFIDTPVKRYSSGMYVKLAFSVAAHLDCEILIVDEVLAVGDAKFQEKCLGRMDEIATKGGRTILYVSHNMNTVKQLCNRCILLDKGEVSFVGNTDEAISRYLGVNGEAILEYDLQSIKRDTANAYLARRANMRRLNICDKKYASYTTDEKLNVELEWEALEDCKDAYIRMAFRYVDSSPAGFATTIEPITVKKGEINRTKLSIDLSRFATGKYYTGISIYKRAEYGGHNILDTLDMVMHFEVENCSKEVNNLPSDRQHRFWGHVVFPAIEIEKQ